MSIEKIDRAVANGSVFLGNPNSNPLPINQPLPPESSNSPPRNQSPPPENSTLPPINQYLPPGNQSPPHSPPANVPGNPEEIPCYYAQRIGLGCAYFGCNHRVSDARSHFCCITHADISARLSLGKYAYVVVDSFFSKEKEQNLRTIIALLNKAEGIHVGIPTVQKSVNKEPEIFAKGPWDWDFINMDFLPDETSRSWLFFHTLSNPNLPTFMFEGATLRWCRLTNRRHVFGEHRFTSSVSYLKQPSRMKNKKMEGVDSFIKGWSLYEHFAVDKRLSLFCLTHMGEETALIDTQLGTGCSPKRKRRGEASEAETKGSSTKKKNDRKQPQRQSELGAAASTRIQKGLIRYLYIVIDFSRAAAETDFRPSRMAVMAKHVEAFIREFFDQNPLSQIGLVSIKNGVAHTLTDLGGTPESHINALMGKLEPLGDYSLQNALELVHEHLNQVPSYGHREVLILYSSLCSCDPGDIMETIQKCKKSKLRCSVIGLSPEMSICKHLCQETGGLYSVAVDEAHLKDLLLEHAPPAIAEFATVSSLNDPQRKLGKISFGCQQSLFGAVASKTAEQEASEEQNVFLSLRAEEAKASAETSMEIAIAKRRREQLLAEKADLAVYKAMMALRIAEAIKAGESSEVTTTLFLD